MISDARIRELVKDAGDNSSGLFEYVISPEACERAIRTALAEHDEERLKSMKEMMELIEPERQKEENRVRAEVWREAAAYALNMPDFHGGERPTVEDAARDFNKLAEALEANSQGSPERTPRKA